MDNKPEKKISITKFLSIQFQKKKKKTGTPRAQFCDCVKHYENRISEFHITSELVQGQFGHTRDLFYRQPIS